MNKEALEKELEKIKKERQKKHKKTLKSWILNGTNDKEFTDIDFELMDEDDNM